MYKLLGTQVKVTNCVGIRDLELSSWPKLQPPTFGEETRGMKSLQPALYEYVKVPHYSHAVWNPCHGKSSKIWSRTNGFWKA